MKALYFDCSMGAAGDMLTAALLELYPEKEKFLAEMNRVFDGKAVVSAAADTKCGVTGTHVTMTVDGEEESEGAQYHDHHRHTDIGGDHALYRVCAASGKGAARRGRGL